MTDRATPFEMADAAERAAFAGRLNVALTVLVDPQRDPASIVRAAEKVGGTVWVLDDLNTAPGGVYDPLAFGRTTSDHPAITGPITIEKDSSQ